MKKAISSMLFVVLCSLSCQSKTTPDALREAPKGRYAIKSGIVEYKTEVMGMAGTQTSTFDDFGNLEVIESTMEMMGMKIRTVTLMRDGYVYTLDMENKTGTRTSGNSPNIDFENLSDEMSRDMNLKKTGTESFLGRNCDNMSIDYTKMNMKGSFLVYKGVPLKIDTDMGSMKMKLVGEKFEENPAIPAGKFEIPSGFTITNL